MTQIIGHITAQSGTQSLFTKVNVTLYSVALWLLTLATLPTQQQKRYWLERRGAADTLQEQQNDRGAVTAEYAIVIMAAVAFAGLLVVIMRSGQVQEMLTQLVQNALNSAG